MREGSTAPLFSTWAPDGGEWSASTPSPITLRKRVPGTHCIEGWLGSHSRSGNYGEQFLAPAGSSANHPKAHYTKLKKKSLQVPKNEINIP